MTKPQPLWHGILLVAGGAIGAGMFALPTASSGAWMLWATLGFIFVWAMTYVAASMLAKVNIFVVNIPGSGLHPASSFDSIVEYTLGKNWARLNNLSISFIMMILMYAFTTAGAGIASYTLENLGLAVSADQRGWLSLLFTFTVGLIVVFGTSTVSRVTMLLIVPMALLFIAVSSSLLPNVQVTQLVYPVDSFPYLWAILPVFVTAFACGGLVPSLVRHYKDQQKNVYRSLFWGTFISLAVYLSWVFLTLGTVERDAFLDIAKKGGDIADLVKALVDAGTSENIQIRITLFSHLAIITSFLSVGLGYFHFLQDKLSMSQTSAHRAIVGICCFLPPAIASMLFPYGFVHAIGLAGLFVTFSFFLLPSIMAYSIRQRLSDKSLTKAIFASAVFGVSVFVLKCLTMLGLLPSVTT